MTQTPSRVLQSDPELARHLSTRTPFSFQHDLQQLPALSLESIAALAEALPGESVVHEQAVKPLVSMTEYVPAFSTPREAGDRIRNIDASDSWMTLLNIEQVPQYRTLVDEQVDALARSAGLTPRQWTRRMGFVFVSSPRSVTPAHFDIEQSLCIQLRGERTLTFGRFADTAEREKEVHRYWQGSFGRIESMPVEESHVRLVPGQACYIPPYTPHWLTNEDAASLSITLTFFSRDNEDESLVQAFNEKVGGRGIRTATYGQHPRRDQVKVAIMRANHAVKDRIRPAKPAARG